MPYLSLVRVLLIGVRLALCARSLACRRYRPGPWHRNAPVPRQGLRHKACSRGCTETPRRTLLYRSPFLFFLCASSIGAFRAFFEAISALGQIVSRLALVLRFFLGSRLAQAFSAPFPPLERRMEALSLKLDEVAHAEPLTARELRHRCV